MPKEVFIGQVFSQAVIREIRRMTQDYPNIYFGTPDYPIPPVGCGRSCKVLEGECKRLPDRQPVPQIIRQAAQSVKRQL